MAAVFSPVALGKVGCAAAFFGTVDSGGRAEIRVGPQVNRPLVRSAWLSPGRRQLTLPR
jgi:hypothetical protein